jgi:two-component system phosphate regulon response regulator PhoB
MDDHEDVRSMLCAALTHRGHECQNVGTCAEALQALASYVPDVVVFEWALRTESGVGLAQELRERASSLGYALVIIVLSVRDEPSGFVRREQVDAYATKPLTVDDLEALVATRLHNN